MTHTRLGMCGKCHADKLEQPVGDRALAIATERIEKKVNDWFKKDKCDTCKQTIQYFIEDGLIYAYCGCDVVDSVKEFKKKKVR